MSQRVTPPEARKIINEYKRYGSISKVAKLFNRDKATISMILHEAGVRRITPMGKVKDIQVIIGPWEYLNAHRWDNTLDIRKLL